MSHRYGRLDADGEDSNFLEHRTPDNYSMSHDVSIEHLQERSMYASYQGAQRTPLEAVSAVMFSQKSL